MAKIKPIRTIDSMSGKVAQDTNISERVRNGKTFSYTWNPETPEKITPKKVLMQYAMKLANIRAKEALANPELKAAYAEELQKDNNYNELRPFIVAKFLLQIKESVLAGDEPTIRQIIDTIRANNSHFDTTEAKVAAISTFLPA